LTRKGIEVRAPLYCPLGDIEAFIYSKQDWLSKRIALMVKQAVEMCAFRLDYGTEILFRGKRYPIVASSELGFDEGFQIPPGLSVGGIRNSCVHIYKYMAKIYFSERVGHFSEIMGVKPSAVKVTNAKRRWGSCSGKKSINFSWRLIMTDDRIIDYVICHELAHILQMDHSAKFWSILKAVMPDCLSRREELVDYVRIFMVEGWS